MIRPARLEDMPLLPAIEDAAAEMFRGTAMEFVLDLPRPPAKPAHAPPPGVFVWVACGTDDRPVGFLEAETIEGWLHVLEVSVHPDWQGRGHARALMDAALAEARALGLARVSLTTDAELPWNGPAYGRRGFEVLRPRETPPWLAAILAHEVSAGFDPGRRIAMARRP